MLEHAYHGHTNTLIDISPYKFDGPGGRGASRGFMSRRSPTTIADSTGATIRTRVKYARHVAKSSSGSREAGRGFIAETLPSVGGQIVFPPGYLPRPTACARRRRRVYRGRSAGRLRAARHALLGIRDAGRGARHRRARKAHRQRFSAGRGGHDAGNRRFIRERDGIFQHFWRQPGAAAAGLAVLDVLEEERLQANALRVGTI